ncbi:PBP1A family penicillin-binding protein [Siccirubricoccus sp. KC 17139]|uniref:Penicillin-binding protein 1A n=1 Tax=Siccirubricoccus soli TaxID=2899147 RepID=A0ABT1DC53_9PROT|nr:PBP1A family penicillin-binding protein [Siccirubricoccus soli]MCO6418754.1 PBP1A family penicillin-binding protein [Siccirubricoccus soli]MCP2684889.1 PBP1A family penicillin-binding protein [Siccirubricoccus soli]
MFRVLFILGAGGLLAGAVGGYTLYRTVDATLPDYTWLADYQPPQMSRIYAADSRLLAELAMERRVFVPIEAIPRRVQQAFVSAEDQRFWEHHGVDPIGIARAVVSNIEAYGTGRRLGGASTITQQVAKNMLVGADRTLTRKLREAILAVRLEDALPKERILEIYLNEIFLGAQAYGVAAAAQAYFGKSLDDLTLAESAFLAVLPKAPNNYNPQRNPEAARARRDWVLDRMAEDGAITRAEAEQAKAEPLIPRPARRPDVVPVGQYFTEEVRRELVARISQDEALRTRLARGRDRSPAELVNESGLVVRTSLDPALQAATEVALRHGLAAYDRRRGGWRGPAARIAATPTEWMPQLEAVAKPPGMLPEWRLAVVQELRERDARLAWLERPDLRSPAQPRNALMSLEEAAWARRALGEGRLGAAPRRMADVLAVGDVVMVEVLPAVPAQGRAAGRPERLALRQVPQVEGAIVALDPATGRVQAMAGGWSFDKSQFNRVTQALRQPGSSFKPFVYLPALEAGVPPNQRFLDGPIEVMTAQGVWRPANYTAGSYNGYVTIRTALEKSLNLVTVRVAQEVGIDKVAETARRFGVIDNMPRYLSMALGAGETTVLKMAAGYASFVNGGHRVTPTLIDSVQGARGEVIWRSEALRCDGCDATSPEGGPPELVDDRPQITDPIAAYQMVNLLTGVVQRGTGSRAGQGLSRPIAGKTGTTNDYFDNWFVGFTPDIVIAVWMGFDDPHTLGNGETGGGNAAPIFREVLEAALRGSPPVPFRAPPGVALVRLPDGTMEAFRPGTENSARAPADAAEGGAVVGGDRGLGGLY